MTIDAVLGGIEIFKAYTRTKYPFAAEHDAIYFLTNAPLSAKDNVWVRALGWYRDEDPVVDGEHVPSPEDENGSTWYCYV